MVKELIQINIYNQSGETQGQVEYDVANLNMEHAEKLVSEVVSRTLANQKKRTSKVKSRSEVLFTNHKPRKQKGSGMARAGSARSPIWVGGGVAHGPKPRNTYYKIPKKLKIRARQDALRLKIKYGDVLLLDSISIPEARTKHMAALVKSLSCEKSVLFVLDAADPQVVLATRNLPRVRVMRAEELSAYDLMRSAKIVLTRKAFDDIHKNFPVSNGSKQS